MERGQTISTEKKLQLVKLLRSEDTNNRIRMRSREELLYGRSGRDHVMQTMTFEDAEAGGYEEPVFSSLKLRMVIAGLLLVGFVVWDNGYLSIPLVKSEQVYEALSEKNSMTNLFAFIEEISYTLKDGQ